jgi:tetratricopeptide (TPR) repeat protein
MTASPLSPTGTRVRSRARWFSRAFRTVATAFLVHSLMLFVLASSGRALADAPVKGELKVSSEGGFVRLAFKFEKEVPASIQLNYPIVVVTFKKAVAISVESLNNGASDLISAARLDPDGTSIRIALNREVRLNTIPVAERLYVDLLPTNWSGVLPGLSPDVIKQLADRALEAERQLHLQRFAAKSEKPLANRVKVATQPTFTRYVFTMPDTANVLPERGDGKLTLDFDQSIKWDLADVRAALPPALLSVDTDVEDDSATVTFTFKGSPQVRTFREDRSIVVDVDHDGSKPKAGMADELKPKQVATVSASAPAGAPAIEPPETVPAKEVAADAPPKAHAAPPADQAVPVPAEAEQKAAEQTSPKEAPKPAMAESKLPAPNPDAPVVAALRETGDLLRAEFPFTAATPAAVFSRADMLWLMFDSAAKIDVGALANDASHAIRSVTLEHGVDGEAIVRIKLERPRLTSLEADGSGWVVTIADTVTAPSKPLSIARNIVGKNHAGIVIPFDHPSTLHRITDSGGDRLMVITALGPARGFLKGQNFVELRALPSTHGVVLQTLADDLAAELSVDKVLISRPGGLSLSATSIGEEKQLVSERRALSFDTQLWDLDRKSDFNAHQAELIRQAALSQGSKRRQARLNLARFYLARDMYPEAKAVLDVMLSNKNDKVDITGTVLRAVTDVVLDRPEATLKDLSIPQVGDQLDAPIWRAIAFARQNKWPQAYSAFKDVDSAISALPLELQHLALRNALRTDIEVRDFNGADRIVNELQSIGVPPAMEPAMAVLSGRLNEALGHNEEALINYRAAADSNDRQAAARGRLREIALRSANGDMPRKDAINALELLTTIWRGDEIEAEGLALLAHFYMLDSRYREELHTWRVAVLNHPNSDYTRKIQDEAAVTFENLFLGGKADALPPVEALGMFYDYRDLTPIGRRGDEMIRRLTDRLVSVDLLDQAAELLQHQVDHRLQGAARAQVATRLAVIYLMNRKPDRAIATLRATRTSDLSNDLREQRLLLEARALSDTGRHDLALELISNINSHEAIRLRSDILSAARRWREAAVQIETLYGERWRDFKPLSETERFDILRAAIGYSLGDEPIGLGRLREKYSAKMADTPDRRAFDVVSAPVGTGSADFQEIAKKIAGVDSLDAFLRDMRARYPDSAPMSPGANKATPPTTPEKPKEKTSATEPPKGPAPALKPDQTPTGSISRRAR